MNDYVLTQLFQELCQSPLLCLRCGRRYVAHLVAGSYIADHTYYDRQDEMPEEENN